MNTQIPPASFAMAAAVKMKDTHIKKQDIS